MLFCRVEVWLLLLLLLVVLLLRGSLIMVSAAAAAAAMSVHFDALNSQGREGRVRRREALFLAAPPLLQQRPSLALRAGLAAAVAIARCHLLHFHRR